MKLITFSKNGKNGLGVLRGHNVIDLAALDQVYNGGAGAPGKLPADMLTLIQQGEEGLSYVRTLLDWMDTNTGEAAQVAQPVNEVSIQAPLTNPGKVVCVGNNYMDHCREQNVEPPKKPMIFSKWASCIIATEETILLPQDSEQVDYEAELAVIIGRRGKDIPQDKAMEHVYGYTIINDVSARNIQFEDIQWVRGKSYDTFAPLGPAIVTADEISDPHNLAIKLDINGQVLQDSNTSNLIFNIPYIISYLSKGFTFEPGDIIATGTPHGVGVFRKPQVFLKSGDVCTIEIEGVGILRNQVK
jgi:2-keto-4-pentenoate hydratase/2-oxohepta-3-ene-1,7-dioic acid hydratase in catechol pathway